MKNMVAAIDFGTSKIVTLVAENSGAQRCDIVGAGIAGYDGFLPEGWNNPEEVNEKIRISVAEAEKQSGDNRTMGRKNTVPYGLYVAYGFVSPALAAQTGFSEEDLETLWTALVNMFDQDHSAARGMMATQKLIIFKHDSELGNAPAWKLFEKVRVARREGVQPARQYSDYTVEVDETLPEGVTRIRMG